MAIFHLNFRRVSRNKDHSSLAKFKYIMRTDEFKNKSGFIYSESFNLPNFAKDKPELFWVGADLHERKNATLCYEIEFALPKELNHQQNINLVKNYIETILPNAPSTFAIHTNEKGENPHCHLMFSDRTMSERVEKLTADKFFKRASKNKSGYEVGGAKKDETLDTKAAVYNYREKLAEVTNQHLKKAGFNEEITHKSYKALDKDKPESEQRVARPYMSFGEYQQYKKDVEEIAEKRKREAEIKAQAEIQALKQAEEERKRREIQALQRAEEEKQKQPSELELKAAAMIADALNYRDPLAALDDEQLKKLKIQKDIIRDDLLKAITGSGIFIRDKPKHYNYAVKRLDYIEEHFGSDIRKIVEKEFEGRFIEAYQGITGKAPTFKMGM